jgi:hypothetical protein
VRNQLFIAYNRKDRKWLEQLLSFLNILSIEHRIQLWDDTAIRPGTKWRAEFEKALSSAKVAVLLVSPDLHASKLMHKDMLPELLDSASKEGPAIFWIPLSASRYKTSVINKYQALINPSKPLDSLTPAKRSAVLLDIANRILSLLREDERAGARRDKRKRPSSSASKTSAVKRGVKSAVKTSAKSAAKKSTKSAAKKGAKSTQTAPEEKRTFVCYAREDASFVLALASALKDEGANLWVDQWDIPGAADFDYEIDKALYECPYFLIVLSPSAVESAEVRSELRTALDEQKRIVPVLYQSCRIPRRLRLLQHIDCTSPDGGGDTALQKILRVLL